MNKFLDLKPTQQQLIDWDIPTDSKIIKEKFSNQLEKFGDDPDFFFAVYSVAANDWFEKKSQGKKVGGLSGHFSTYLKKESKRRNKGEDVLSKLLNSSSSEVAEVEKDFSDPSPIQENNNESVFSLDAFPEDDEDSNTDKNDGSDPFPIESNSESSESSENSESLESLGSSDNADSFLTKDPVDFSEPLESDSDVLDPVSSDDNFEQPDSSGNSTNSENLSLLLLNDEEDEEEDLIGLDENESFEDEGFEKEKRKRSTMMTFIIISFVVLIGAGLIMSVLAKAFDEEPTKEEEPIPDYSKYKKGRVDSVSASLNKGDKQELKDNKPVEDPVKPQSSGGSGTRKPRKNMNTKKDEEILAEYADSNDSAASGGYAGGARAGRTHFVPGGSKQQGGVYYKGRENKDDNKGGTFQLHNKKVRVRLEFSIRSTAPSTVVAIVQEGSDKIPTGAKFYGRASGYVNKRTQIRFNQLIIGEENFQVNGFAISGRDPGIESEVTDISKTNIGASIKQGIAKTASGVIQKYAGTVGQTTGDAASNTTDPTAAEIEKQQEANKLTEEYRVPAGTSFYIYLE